MRRSAVLITMLLALLWQTLAVAQPGGLLDALSDIGHAALHWQDRNHHHAEDGSIQLDDSAESLRHVMADQAHSPVLLPAGSAPWLRPGRLVTPAALDEGRVPEPFLDGLLRPPRQHA